MQTGTEEKEKGVKIQIKKEKEKGVTIQIKKEKEKEKEPM